MAHISRKKDKLIARARRLKGQTEGIERALQSGAPCAEVLRQITSVRGAVSGLMAEVMEDHSVSMSWPPPARTSVRRAGMCSSK